MRKPLVAGNWKMNGSRQAAQALIEGVLAGMPGVKAEVALCPPFVYLGQVKQQLQGSAVAMGAQNVSHHDSGAFTGEISPAMLKDMGCDYVIIGHSERRALYGEDDAVVADKLIAVSKSGLKPIFCVGELLEERQQGETEAVVARQLDAVLNKAGGLAALANAVIAYEPVWAIGTGMTATPDQAQSVHAFIRQRLAAHDGALAQKMRLLYGGSVKGDNASELFAQKDIDGGLIGGASLKAGEFLAICRAAV
jgi:triosephosphate isomerase